MEARFTKSMTALHTWAGVLLGGLLLAIFWMGTLSVFDREIDRWMMPGTRLPASLSRVSLDRLQPAVSALLPAQARQWRVDLPTGRVPVLRLSTQDVAGKPTTRMLDPTTYQPIPDQGTAGGSGFLFPFHYGLHLPWLNLGKWLVGCSAMAMLLLLVSGVLIHQKLFADFFTFRPHKHLQRSSLDLHNLTGVIGLPFHFVVTLSGLIIFIGIYFPQAHQGAYGSGDEAKATFTAEAYGRYARPAAGQPGTPASLDAMVARAERQWGGGQPYFVRVWHPGDANSYVELRRSYARDITMNLDQIYFDARTGSVLDRFAAAPVMTVQRFISGLHFIQFEHWTLRWLYFILGLSGCVMIATGLLFWIGARRARHARNGRAGVRVVEGLAIGSVTGIVIATLAYFAANRLLPPAARWAGEERAVLEMWAFYLGWAGCFCHGWLRPRKAWREQAWTLCALALACVLLNGATTGDHLLRAAASERWAVAGMDALLLILALIAAIGARRLGRPTVPKPTADSRPRPAVLVDSRP